MCYKFVKKNRNKKYDWSDKTKVIIELDSNEATIDDLIEVFESFLKACGYVLPVNARIDLVYDEE